MRIAAHGSLKRGSARLGSFCRFFPFAPRPKRSGVRACDGLATPRSPSSGRMRQSRTRRYRGRGAAMNDTRFDIWLNIGSVILLLMLIASFTAVFRAALSAH